MVTTWARSNFGDTTLTPEQGTMSDMPYPARPRREPLPEFRGQRGRWLPPGSTSRLTKFVVKQYNDGRSLREISELVDRSHREVANILNAASVPRRPVGAARVRQSPSVQRGLPPRHGDEATKTALTPGSLTQRITIS
jgi:hypothetical protein